MGVTVTIDGLDELEAGWSRAVGEMKDGLAELSLEAAAEGAREAQFNHPYTDRTFNLTDTSHAEQVEDSGGLEAEMVWPMVYASFVDKGTSRNRPYPFTPQAEEEAAKVLAYGAEHVVDTALAKV